ncbi:hypothetical protein [Photobacterium leiognathi]|uniref:hypothetical protein n=1 Tax=Photobacterium leiognathi TaxID=553611 RepID=UPI0029829DC2|nr:hypothetical protein [Photobacterium leiognathi]
MDLSVLNYLIERQGYLLSVFEDRYGRGCVAVLSYKRAHLVDVEECLELGDLDSIPAYSYLTGIDWLPIVFGDNIVDALEKLESRLSLVPSDQLNRSSEWGENVTSAFDNLIKALNSDSLNDLLC